ILETAAGPHGSAHAAPSSSAARDPRGSNRVPLPRGVHQKANGRYVRDLCHDSPSRILCGAMELLPESWQPGDPLSGPPPSDNDSAEPDQPPIGQPGDPPSGPSHLTALS